MQKWYYCSHCGNKVAKFEPLDAVCSAVYVKCRKCKEIVEIKLSARFRKPQSSEKNRDFLIKHIDNTYK